MGASKSISAAPSCPDVKRSAEDFDAAYYARHYEDPESRASDAAAIERLGAFVFRYLDYLHVDIDSVLDLGCGLGHWKPVVAAHAPEASYHGVEWSPYLCEKFGWERGSVTEYQGKPADPVVCQGVLQYLDDAEATAALERLHALTRTALYLEVLTELDLQVACDTSRTDGEVFLRTGKWYWEALAGKFIAVGGGLFLPTDTDVPLFELESLDPRL